MNRPCSIYGIHGLGGEFLLKGKGWIVFTHGIGDNPDDHAGFDYRRWSDQGYGIIARLNYGYGIGTIPVEGRYSRFAGRCAQFVEHSLGCRIWIVGNEPNHAQERPNGIAITPRMYADCYTAVWQAIKGLATDKYHEIVPAPIAPWNNQTTYHGNRGGDWIGYFTDVLRYIMEREAFPGAIALHTYTHGHDPSLITSEARMDPPFHQWRYNFRSYIDFMKAIPVELGRLPVYITETDANDPWSDINNGWVQEAYAEIDRWNRKEHRTIFALVLYRWQYDRWQFKNKLRLHEDIRAAVEKGYTWCIRRKQLGVRCHV